MVEILIVLSKMLLRLAAFADGGGGILPFNQDLMLNPTAVSGNRHWDLRDDYFDIFRTAKTGNDFTRPAKTGQYQNRTAKSGRREILPPKQEVVLVIHVTNRHFRKSKFPLRQWGTIT
jgi:hypothetical protein